MNLAPPSRLGRLRALTLAVPLLAAALAWPALSLASGDAHSAHTGHANVAAAAKLYETRPTSINIPRSDKITKTIPRGKTIDFISCGITDCSLQAPILQKAAKLFGWKVNLLNTNASPTQVQAAMTTAITQKVDGIIINGTEAAEIGPQLRAARAAHIPIAECCVVNPRGTDGILFTIGNPTQTAGAGKGMAAWVAAAGHGKANTVYVNLQGFPIDNSLGVSFRTWLRRYCSGCLYHELEVPVTSLGPAAPTTIVNYLRANPSIKYVVLASDDLGYGLPAALSAAGLGDVKLIGNGGDSTTASYVASGSQTADEPFPYYEDDFDMMDALFRYYSGQKQLTEAPPRSWIVTKGDVPTTKSVFPLVKNYLAEYKSLWGVK